MTGLHDMPFATTACTQYFTRAMLLQDEITALKQELHKERLAAAAANELRAAAVEQMHLAEQQHQQQLLQLEENVKGFKWKLWEVEADAARRDNAAHRAQQQQQQQQRQSKDAWKHMPIWADDEQQDVQASIGADIGVGPAAGAIAGTGGAASASWQGGAGEFSVQLVARPGLADQLEMLPEVVRLFELHRSTMSRSVV
jgi:hypothetical protein